jgi:hypothetical protein
MPIKKGGGCLKEFRKILQIANQIIIFLKTSPKPPKPPTSFQSLKQVQLGFTVDQPKSLGRKISSTLFGSFKFPLLQSRHFLSNFKSN